MLALPVGRPTTLATKTNYFLARHIVPDTGIVPVGLRVFDELIYV
ncbi:Uncharacterised protein [Yersinia frederiksenii]|nr:Uncharacterised protein [Yersinia frederiksenii]